jgi:ABC-2 type transport system ATP-binding protein
VVALEIRGLSKTYRSPIWRRPIRQALRNLSLSVPVGELFAFLGPNGSGKTTTLKILMGLIEADAGDADLLGSSYRSREWRFRTGYLPEHPYFYDYLTPNEYLDYVGRLLGLPARVRHERTGVLLERLGLSRSRDVALRRCSKGMLQRLGIAQALVNDPELVILDEPMSGLDPLGRRLVRNLILDLKRAGKTVFFSTHILSDAEALADRVGLLRSGELLQVGRLDDILSLDVAHLEVLVSGGPGVSVETPGVRALAQLGERWRLEVEEGALVEVVARVAAGGGRVLSVQPVKQSLEDYFFRQMGEPEGLRAWELEA